MAVDDNHFPETPKNTAVVPKSVEASEITHMAVRPIRGDAASNPNYKFPTSQ